MRSRILFLSLAVAVVTAFWFSRAAEHDRLRSRLEEERDRQRTLASLCAERDRLRARLPSAEQLASLRAAGAERRRLQDVIVARSASLPVPSLPVGEWVSSQAWENRGRATPAATVETVLWAAAGGDLPAIESLLELDPSARTKAGELLARLPLAARDGLTSPEALVAAITAKQIPLSHAQIAWLHETDDGRAAIALLLDRPDPEPAVAAGLAEPAPGPLPPSLPATGAPKLAVFALRRSPDGWRLVVPGEAIDRIARTFAPAGG